MAEVTAFNNTLLVWLTANERLTQQALEGESANL
jgi:hypothetical protein